MRFTRYVLIVTGVLATVGVASADFTFGNGRSFGMARAGLAVPYDFQHSAQLNPAIYGLGNGEFKFTIPKVGLRLQGIGYSDLKDVFSNVSGGGVNQNTVQRLAKLVGGHDTEFGVDSDLGIAFGGMGINVSGGAVVTGRPNQQLAAYINSGGNLNSIPDNATQFRFDGYGVANYDVDLAYGRRVHMGPGDDGLSIGARVHILRTYYSHYTVNRGSALNNSNQAAVPGEDMGTDTVKSTTAFGLDVGSIWSTGKDHGVFVGAVIENLIRPNTSFDSVSPTSAQAASNAGGIAAAIDSSVDPYRRRVNLGVGYMAEKDFVMAADLYDFFGGANRQLRTGLEYSFGGFALRGGYATGDGVTYGFGIAGLNFAFGSNMPLGLSTAFKF